MKNIFVKRLSLSLALSGAALPLVLIGCGGGNGNGLSPAKTRPSAAPTPTPGVTALPEFSFAFNGAQTAHFSDGTLTSDGVLNGFVTVTGAQSDPLQVPPGTYPLTGTLDDQGRFTLNQGTGSPYNFTLVGTLPTQTTDGNFTFTAQNGATQSGTIPRGTVAMPAPTATSAPTATGVPFATATATGVPSATATAAATGMPSATATAAATGMPGVPGSTPTASAAVFTGTLDFSGVSAGSSADTSALNLRSDVSGGAMPSSGRITTFPLSNNGELLEANIEASIDNGADRSLSVSFRSTGPSGGLSLPVATPFFAGQRLSFPEGSGGFSGVFRQSGVGVTAGVWQLASFDVLINSVTPVGADNSNINFTLSNAVFRPGNPNGEALPLGMGTFTLDGTVDAAGLTVTTSNQLLRLKR